MEISVRCINDHKVYTAPEGVSLMELCRRIAPDLCKEAVSAKVNNVNRGLMYRVYNNSDVEFLTIASSLGMSVYTRTLLFVLSKAVANLYEGVHLSVEAPISNGYYIYLRKPAASADTKIKQNGGADNSDVGGFSPNVGDIRREMDAIIKKDIPFERVVCPTDQAIAVFDKYGMHSKSTLLRTTGSLYTTYYLLDGYPDYYYSALCPSTGYIHLYGLENYHDGLLLRLPDPENPSKLKPHVPQEKMLEVFNEHHRWQDLGCLRTIGEMNEYCAKGYTNDLINVSEALQERKICHIAEDIAARKARLVLIAGPSSSGKTTFSKRLSVQLMTCGIRPRPISLDDFFLPRVQTPRDADGNYDYESIDALNLPLLYEQMQSLFRGEEVELPKYDFQSGESLGSGKKLRLAQNDVLVIEGIHALNPKLTQKIPAELKYKVYVSALTTIQLDDHNYIPTSDNRLLRRIVRDYKFRGYSAQETISRWPSVQAGERKWIFPFQEDVDVMFNSALLFELAGLRTQALPLLEMVPENAPEYAEAYRLRKFLRYINPIKITGLPQDSLLREFLGGSSFHY